MNEKSVGRLKFEFDEFEIQDMTSYSLKLDLSRCKCTLKDIERWIGIGFNGMDWERILYERREAVRRRERRKGEWRKEVVYVCVCFC